MFTTLRSPTDLVSEYIQPLNDPRLERHKTILEMGNAGERGGARGWHRCGDPPRTGAGLSVSEGEGREEGVRWEGAGALSSKHLWDPSTSLMCRSLGYWLPPQPTPQHFSTRALTSLLSPPSLPVFVPLTLHLFPPLPRSLFSLSLHPLQSVLYPRGPRYPPTPSPAPSLHPSLISTLQRLVINASFNCHAHFYAH